MPFRVRLTSDAENDLRRLVGHMASHRGASAALEALDQIEALLSTLSEFPMRGAFPKELLALGIREYREVLIKPYRIVYTVGESDVFVLLIADGRQDFRALLGRRLLEG